MGDVSSPLKALLPDYKAIEKRVHAAIMARFGLPSELPDCVKAADLVMLATERRDLMPAEDNDTEWSVLHGVVPLMVRLEPMHPVIARALFLRRYAEITGGKIN
jgi:hypothetical protein